MSFIKHVAEGGKVPWFHGIIGDEPTMFRAVAVAPMPFHLVVKWYWSYLQNYRLTAWDRKIMLGQKEAYNRGYEAARARNTLTQNDLSRIKDICMRQNVYKGSEFGAYSDGWITTLDAVLEALGLKGEI